MNKRAWLHLNIVILILAGCTLFSVPPAAEPVQSPTAVSQDLGKTPTAIPQDIPKPTPTAPQDIPKPTTTTSQDLGKATIPNAYDIGKPTLQDLWVDPTNGKDGNSGTARNQAFRTITAAWNRVPQGTLTTTGYRILLAAGDYSANTIPEWIASRRGTLQFPIILQAADGPHTARLHGYLNINDIRYLYLVNLDIVTDRGYGGGSNVVHIASSDHILIRGSKLDGFDGKDRQPQETLKVNQTQNLYIEDNDIAGAFWFPLDLVAVQYAHILNNRFHNSGDHCAVLKGGTAYFRVEGNEIYDCGANGFMAGQGTGFEFMVSPWLHYEAYDIKFINNVVHDTTGAGMGVNGGYNILMAYNTLYRIGEQSHMIEVALGTRGCDGDTSRCDANRATGGWGMMKVGGDEPIPNRNVYIYNNIVYNPSGYQSQWQHLAVRGPGTPSSGSNIPSPAQTDTNLQIRGNLIWNGPPDHAVGVEEPGEGCQPSNPTCNASQLRTQNAINTLEPKLADPGHYNLHLAKGSNVFSATTYSIPDFSWSDAPARPPVPAGNLSNRVPVDRDSHSRTSPGPPGAYMQ
jgi:hypothetical protein